MVGHLSNAFTKIANFLIQWAQGAFPPQYRTGLKTQCLINSDFYQDDITGAELVKWMEALQAGSISFDAFYYNLSKKEVYPPGWDISKERTRLQDTVDNLMSGIIPKVVEYNQPQVEEPDLFGSPSGEDSDNDDED